MLRAGMSLCMTWRSWPPGQTFWRGQPVCSLRAVASPVRVRRPCHHWHRRLPCTTQRSLPACHDPPSGPLLSWPARFWWHYPPPHWISLGIQFCPALYPLWWGRLFRGRHSISAPPVGSTRRSPRFYTYEGPLYILTVQWGGVASPRGHRLYWSPGIPGRGGLVLYWRSPGQYLTPLYPYLSLFRTCTHGGRRESVGWSRGECLSAPPPSFTGSLTGQCLMCQWYPL